MPTDKKISDLPVATAINPSDVSVLVDNNTDYQYTFTVLLQFLEANLTTGAVVSFGTLLPANTTGNNGDVFVNTSAGSFAQKISGTWTIVYTLPAANAADGTVLYGAGVPASSTGKNSDTYINTLTGIFYQKTSGAWSQVFSMATGPQGPQGTAGTNGTNGTNGNTILFGTVDPSNISTGVDGNFYINTTTYAVFGPKTSGSWGSGVAMIGAGLPTGGTTGQVLYKTDGADYDTGWQDLSFANISGQTTDNANLTASLAAKQNSLGFTPENTANKGAANGYASLDGSGKVPSAQLPSFVDEVQEYTNLAAFPGAGVTGVIYIALDNNYEYRWSGSTYVQLVASPGSTDAVPEGTSNLYFTAARVLAAVLTGIGFSTATAVAATDTILQAIGKLQAQITALFKIPTGGTAGQVLAKIDSTDGNTQWVTPSSGSGAPGGSSGQIQFNNSGALGGSANLTWDSSTQKFFSNSANYDGYQLNAPSMSGITISYGTDFSSLTSFGYIGAGQSSHIGNSNDFSIMNIGGGGLSIEANNIYFFGNLFLPVSGTFGSNASGSNAYINYFANPGSGAVQLGFNYGGSSGANLKNLTFDNAANHFTSPQNPDDFVVSTTENIIFGNNAADNVSSVYMMLNAANKSLLLNGGGDFNVIDCAQLQIDSASKGFLPPRMTTSQKNAIESPTEGLVVYDITLHKLCIYTISTWETVTSS